MSSGSYIVNVPKLKGRENYDDWALLQEIFSCWKPNSGNCTKIKGTGFEINEEDGSVFVMAGLPEKFAPMIMAIEHSGIAINSDVIKTKLLDMSSQWLEIKRNKNQDIENRQRRGVLFRYDGEVQGVWNYSSEDESHTPEQNGLCERFNRTIVERARCLLLMQRWKRNYGPRQVFGSPAMMHVPKAKRLKWDKKAVEIHSCVGYSENIKGYRLYNPETKKICTSRDVIIMERSDSTTQEDPTYVLDSDIQSSEDDSYRTLSEEEFDPWTVLKPTVTRKIQEKARQVWYTNVFQIICLRVVC
ncbi:Retrovirus-related Pol polyprotein from transposon TNT 1-94 [Eumeta japonica]|uniref:Retrovirus-related Pol polyprotein from transposon TNT 1-94 n=1 Tax=Eumeta variegata TaxID=151549 RepID=A0A4C1SGN5_EUMVA|nr:Retrovirus-related Pol polyprotein from transposon TNT 1-94 [Eumeta japonica]